jgi:SanA protein
MRIVRRYYRQGVICILALVAFVLVTPIAMRFAVQPFTYESARDVPKTSVAMILGASVFRGAPSPVLAQRADTAIALYQSGKVQKILVTGDNGALTHDEVTPVRKYLLDAGIPAQDIFLDHAGFDTYSSMYRARDVFQATSITVATQDFHLPRALWLARHLGLTAYGVAAEGQQSSVYEYLREIPASFKAIWDLISRREPKYLGPVIPLSGDGKVTWY